MRVTVVGAGPAGLCAGLLLKQSKPTNDVLVFDRGRPGETEGWGITLPRRMLRRFEQAAPAAAQALLEQSTSWDEIHVFHRGRRVAIAGMPLVGIGRLALLDVLRGHCQALGVPLTFDTAVDPSTLPVSDLVVIADGAGSRLRQAFAPDFGTSTRAGRNRYAWLGTTRVFEGLTLAFAQTDDGVYIGHGYPYAPGISTFVVECSEETWTNARLDERASEECCAYLAQVFIDCLSGARLLYRGAVRWASFTHVANERWRRDAMVLVGDAAHAIHFSVGSGTMLAMDDAIALVEAMQAETELDAALERFERTRKHTLESFYAMESTTVTRLEGIAAFMHLEPLDLAYVLLGR